MVKRLAKAGLTNNQMAEICEINISNWNEWKATKPDFRDALKDWKRSADGQVERSLYERAMGYSCTETKVFNQNGVLIEKDVIKHYPPETTAQIFWLKNRQPEKWRDKQVVKIKLPEDATPAEKCALVTKAVSEGKITPEAGNAMIQGLKDQINIEEATEREKRLAEIEQQLGITNG